MSGLCAESWALLTSEPKVRKRRSKNFSDVEKQIFLEIKELYPILDEKGLSSAVVNEKKMAWKSVEAAFNSYNGIQMKRDIAQLQILHKRIKHEMKKARTSDSESHNRSAASGTDDDHQDFEYEDDDLLLDKKDCVMVTNGIDANTSNFLDVVITEQDRKSSRSKPQNFMNGSELCYGDQLLTEYHYQKMVYLKEEHDMKMKIMKVELETKEVELLTKREILLRKKGVPS